MSIVERALRRMQGGAAPATAPRRFGRVVQHGSHDEPTPVAAPRTVAIDQKALRAAGLLPPEHQERQIASQYRQIKRPLIVSALGENGAAGGLSPRVIMVASAMPGEGKTFTTINLAFSMALEQDVRVVLVDADVAKPQISRMFGVAGEPGLLDILADRNADSERMILPTDVPHLSLLPAGRGSDKATELLASEQMSHALDAMLARDPARILLFDSPPLLLTTESQVLARSAGQIVVVVRADVTAQHVLLDALSHLPESSNVSLLLNQSMVRQTGSYYYGYGQDAPAEAG